jgi:hypothetical protein
LPTTISKAAGDGLPDQIILPISSEQVQLAGGDYLSPTTETPRPFTHLLIRREATVPANTDLTLALRVSSDGQSWSDWSDVPIDEADSPTVAWSAITNVGMLANFWQVRVQAIASPEGQLPTLRGLQVNTVDTTNFPTPRPGLANTRSAGLAAVDKPAVVSRSAWGSPDGQGSRVPPQYRSVTHMIVHHTATTNNASDWGREVRAIWSFHTITRGWGDIGYNYIIDPNGTIYEGRAGGDDAVGFHDKANYGSMGVSFLGNFDTGNASEPAKNSLVNLLAWKASQQDIDPLGSSFYYGCQFAPECRTANSGTTVLTIAGHRQVLGSQATTCPGRNFFPQLTEIRLRVLEALVGNDGDNGDLQVDELEEPRGFAKSNVQWDSAPCGAGGHTYYTFTTDRVAESTHNASWTPTIPTTGVYRIYAAVPQGCDLPGQPTKQPEYVISHASGETRIRPVLGQGTPEQWVSLGTYTFRADDPKEKRQIRLSDLTGEPYSTDPARQKIIFFDAIKLEPEDINIDLELSKVEVNRTTIAAGELVQVRFTVKNNGSSLVRGQAPRADLAAIDLGLPDDSYVYDQEECFAGDQAGNLPNFAKETNRIRVTLGIAGWDAANIDKCNAPVNAATGRPETSDNPWRWGLNSDLGPGESQTLTGYVRFRKPGLYTLRANIIQEYIRYLNESAIELPTITVTPERTPPVEAQYNAQLQPQAQVYELATTPSNLLARSTDPTAVQRGTFKGSFSWWGERSDWGTSGPFGVNDRFLIEQTRAFIAPVSGNYTFRTISDDGSWLWVNGKLVIANAGVRLNNGPDQASDAFGGGSDTMTATVELKAGIHSLSFRMFESTGIAYAAYEMKLPGATRYGTPIDSLGNSARFGTTYTQTPTLTLVADDQQAGGNGSVKRMRWQINNGAIQNKDGSLVQIGPLINGNYVVRYWAEDLNNNAIASTQARELRFAVNTNLKLQSLYVPFMAR